MDWYGEMASKAEPSPGTNWFKELGAEAKSATGTVPPVGGTGSQDSSGIVDDPNRALPLDLIFRASTFPKTEDKIAYMAKESGMDPRRFGVIDGNVVYNDPDTGEYVRAVPSVTNASGVMDAWQRFSKWASGEIVPSIPQAAGAAASTAAATLTRDPVKAAVAGSAAAGGVDYVRQVVGNLMTGKEDAFSNVDFLNIGGEAVISGGGSLAGSAMVRAGSKNTARISHYDRKAAMDPQTRADTEAAMKEARSEGVDLTAGQASGLPSALTGERQLSRDAASADIMAGKYAEQRNQIGSAVQRRADSLSPVQSVDEGVNAARSGAQEAVVKARAERWAQAEPLYDEAFKANMAVESPEINRILTTPEGKRALREAARIMGNDRSLLSAIDPEKTAALKEAVALGKADAVPGGVGTGLKLRTLDYVRRSLWDMAEAAKNSTTGADTAKSRSIRGLWKDLTDTIDDADVTRKAGPKSFKPEGGAYKRARAIFAEESPAVTDLELGPVGTLARKEGGARVGEIRTLFNANQSNPGVVRRARAAFINAGRGEDWNATVATYIRDSLDAASKGEGVSARRLVSSMWSDPRQKEILRAAMSPDQFDGFSRVMSVVQKVARTLPEGSPTATDQIGMEAMRSTGTAVRVLNTARDVMNLKVGDALFDRVTLKMSDRGMVTLAKAVTHPDAPMLLHKLRMLSPGSEMALMVTGQILSLGLTESAGAVLPVGRRESGPMPQNPQSAPPGQ